MSEQGPLERLGRMAASAMVGAAGEAVRRLDEAVPGEARVHLWKAQREIFLAASAMVEQQRRGGKKKRRGSRRAHKIDLD